MNACRATEDEEQISFQIPLVGPDFASCGSQSNGSAPSDQAASPPCNVPQHCVNKFREDGFIVIRGVLSQHAVDALNDRLEDVLRGDYDRGTKPDKTPKLIKIAKPLMSKGDVADNDAMTAPQDPSSSNKSSTNTSTEANSQSTKQKRRKQPKPGGAIGFTGNLQNVKVLQIINIHKCDSLFRTLETAPILGTVVARLAGWDCGARLAQDQVWAKPPGASPLVFHRDSPYFMFEPDDVVTVWIALDDMDEELGPLQYVPGSHRWGDGRVGSASQFFQGGAMNLLRSAAEREGVDWDELEGSIVSMAGLQAGGMSIHDGKTWHGSSKNSSSSKPRRGLGLHFVPANVRFTAEARHSRLWRPHVEGVEAPETVKLSPDEFPIVGY